RPDAFDAVASNDTFASATALALAYGGVTVSGDLTTVADVDYYRVTVPPGSDGTLTVSVDARNLSRLIPKVSVYDAAGNLVRPASGSGRTRPPAGLGGGAAVPPQGGGRHDRRFRLGPLPADGPVRRFPPAAAARRRPVRGEQHRGCGHAAGHGEQREPDRPDA